MPSPIPFMQPVLSGPGLHLNQKIEITSIPGPKLSPSHLSVFLDSAVIGLAPGFSAKGKLISLALCDRTKALIIDLDGPGRVGSKKESPKVATEANDSGTSSDGGSPSTIDSRRLLEDTLLCRDVGSLAAFDMAPLAMGLYSDLAGLRIKNAVDVQALFPDSTRKPYSVVETALQHAHLDKVKPSAERIESEFENAEYFPDEIKCRKELICRAWLAQYLMVECVNPNAMEEEMKKIDTKQMSSALLDIVAKISSDAHRLSLSKPSTTKHRISGTRAIDGMTNVNAASYKDKFRGENLTSRVIIDGERGRYVHHATINSTSNGSGAIDSTRSIDLASNLISVVETIGRGDPTLAEARRAETILKVLQGEIQILADNPWIQNIWFPTEDGSLVWPEEWVIYKRLSPPLPSSTTSSEPQHSYKMPQLNGSQQRAVNSMLSHKDSHRIVTIQGPPGTGKTSVIAAYVLMASQMGVPGIWLIAQSNVAVKNIALKLLTIGFEDWKILVAKDFHNGWHEHLYTEDSRFQGHLILSDRFSWIKPREMLGCKIILSTLSMLSNRSVFKFIKYVPMNVMVVDEASQIEIGSYVTPFTTFSSLRKICFIGDNKQLPPHGQEDLKNLQSIFEVPHLEKSMIFLNTQYRMPPGIGDIISSTVYDGKLKSNPTHPVLPTTICCHFVDIADGNEAKEGKSWKNVAEKAAVLKLAQFLQNTNMAYKIITPYEGQTSLIEAEMKKTEGLSWADKCFNVDAFQGNEEDYIIISLVRSRGLGFLDNLRRTNVMLTRCKRGMFIFTSRKFMDGVGGESLVGEMLDLLEERQGDKVWLTGEDIEEGRIFSSV